MSILMNNHELRKVIESRKFLFFGGKGRVGETTMAATTAAAIGPATRP